MNNIISVTKESFERVLAEHELVVLDFWATWCQPCKSFAKVIEQLAPSYPDVVFASIDIEQEKELAADFNITSVPTVMLLKQKVVVFADSGALPASALKELLDQAKTLDVSNL